MAARAEVARLSGKRRAAGLGRTRRSGCARSRSAGRRIRESAPSTFSSTARRKRPEPRNSGRWRLTHCHSGPARGLRGRWMPERLASMRQRTRATLLRTSATGDRMTWRYGGQRDGRRPNGCRFADGAERVLAAPQRVPGRAVLLSDLRFSIRINMQWRICFEWPDGQSGPSNVEIVDYH
jgi:hypothetical protein